MTTTWVLCEIDGVRYVVDTRDVAGVTRDAAAVGVVDLCARFGTRETEPATDPIVLVMNADGAPRGLRVDAVLGTLRAAANDVAPPPAGIGARAAFIAGVLVRNDSATLVLDLRRALCEGDPS